MLSVSIRRLRVMSRQNLNYRPTHYVIGAQFSPLLNEGEKREARRKPLNLLVGLSG